MKFQRLTKLMAAAFAAVMIVGGVKVPVKAEELPVVIAQEQRSGYYAKISYLSNAAYFMNDYQLTTSKYHKYRSRGQGLEIDRVQNISCSALQFNVSYFSSTVTSNAWAIDLALDGRTDSYPSMKNVVNFESHIANLQFYYNGEHTYGITIGQYAPTGYYNIFPLQDVRLCRWEKYSNANSPAPNETGLFVMPYGTSFVCCAYSSTVNGSTNGWTMYHRAQ